MNFTSPSRRPWHTSNGFTSITSSGAPLGKSKIVRQTVKYKGGEILNGQSKDGKVKSAEIVSKFRPPKAEASMWLLARRFPERWGPQAKGAAHEGKAPDRRATVIFYKLDKNGRVCDLVLPSDPHFSSEMLKAPDVLQRVQKALLAAGHSVDEFGHSRPTA